MEILPILTAALPFVIEAAKVGAGEIAKAELVNAYQAVKALIIRKAGADSTATTALTQLEKRPDSPGWREELGTALKESGLDKDAELLAALARLRAQLPASPVTQNVRGNANAVAANGSTASVTIHR